MAEKKDGLHSDGVITVDAAVQKNLIETHTKEKLRIIGLPKDDKGMEVLEIMVLVPSRGVMSQVMKFVDSNPKKAQEILINSCVLTNKDEVHNDDHLFTTAFSQLTELFPIRQGYIKNL